MNLTMNSTIIELSVHACNFVLKTLQREEPEARVWLKLILKLQPKIAIFSKFHYTVFTRIDAAALISFFTIQLRRLFQGGVYSGAAFTQKPLYSVLNTALYIVSFY